MEVHQWVRIKKGTYKDDLGLVEAVEGTKKAWVKLIPRIPDDAFSKTSEVIYNFKKDCVRDSQLIRVP